MDVQTIAVIGAGPLGRTIALAAARAGYRTIVEDVSSGRLEEALAWIRKNGTSANVSQAATLEDALCQASLIIDAVPDELEMKIELFTIFDKFARPNAIFVSTTSSLSIRDLAEVTFCPDRCIGMRFVDQDAAGSLIRLICGPETSDETAATCTAVARRMNASVVVIRDAEDAHAGESAVRRAGTAGT
jgi:3-hydroxybutyryl-CoA dehydrogenase